MSKLPIIILLTAVLVQSAMIMAQVWTIERFKGLVIIYERAMKNCVVKP